MATVQHVEHPDGSHSVGVTIDGVYHKLASIDAARVEQGAQRVAALRERADAGDEDAAGVLANTVGGESKGGKS